MKSAFAVALAAVLVLVVAKNNVSADDNAMAEERFTIAEFERCFNLTATKATGALCVIASTCKSGTCNKAGSLFGIVGRCT